MNTKYIDLIDQTYFFPTEEFKLEDKTLHFHDIDLMELVEQYGSPLKFTYLPKISDNIQRAQRWFNDAFAKADYKAKYHYCYCTKSSHFKHVLDTALTNDIHLETSSAFDIDIIKSLKAEGKIKDDTYIISNGFKREKYIDNIADLINSGHKNCIPIIDNYEELDLLTNATDKQFKVGIRIASEEEPKFEFYTSRLGIGYKNILSFYKNQIQENKQVSLKMLHFFINTGIRDNAYYWNELHKCLKVYISLKKICPSLDSLNIGGGFPIKNSLAFEFDYEYMINEIVNQIKQVCDEADVDVPHIFTEFGSFTVGESGGAIYKVLYQKQQNDREKWNMINSSFITTLPDSWAISKRFIMLALNRWNEEYERVLLGGLTCDSDDYYNSEQNVNAIYLPKYHKDKPLYIGFFNTGAYQETIGGYGGIQHCLIPAPKHILIDRDENGAIQTRVFKEQQSSEQMLDILGY
ncbi:type III PLP-dependent enzyme domain-containing protein [Nonlabens ulvanivorans]|uniref:Decarboxylase n=1 Tax=Nonlabens ulvanivorans TaxID=906888 RepID=A0A084JSY7_NONUL|nr:decarboxylase [Nonlabens ulvanivorans]KEZ92071.1 decarboxylase [Nonlabens ulvanivorans]PRX14899.1 arginine decarboxylase [Nonlabens ulvanivorans]